MKKLMMLVLAFSLIMASLVVPAHAEGDSYRTLYSSEVTTLNYLTTATAIDFALSANVIDTLVEYDKYGIVQPCIAESWSVSDDGLTWTFKLRKNATWVTYQGEYVANVTANDFVAAAQYILNESNASSTADVFYSVVAGAEDYYNSTVPAAEGEAAKEPVDFETVGIKAIDDYTLQYTLFDPCPYFESMLTYVCFMPVYAPFLEEKGASFGVADGPDSILYCGAYLLSEFKPQEKRVLTKNAANWDADGIYIDTIEYIYNKEALTIGAEMYRRGEIDSASIDATTASEWLSNPETASLIRPVRQTGFYSNFFAFNFDAQFDEAYEPANWMLAANNEAFRKSFYYGLDRVKAMLVTEPDNPESIMFNTVTPPDYVNVNGIDYTQLDALKDITNLYSATFDEAKALEYKAQAVAELTEAGATFPVKTLLKYDPTVVGWDGECLVVEQQLEALLGADYIDIIVEAGPSTGFLSAVRRNGNYALLKCNWGPDYADPQTYTDPFSVDNTYNFMDKGANPDDMAEYYALVDAAKAITVDIKARYDAFAEAEAYLIGKSYIIPFGYRNGGYTASRIDPFTSQYAPFGISNERFKGAKLLEAPMDTDAYFDASDAWIEERATLVK